MITLNNICSLLILQLRCGHPWFYTSCCHMISHSLIFITRIIDEYSLYIKRFSAYFYFPSTMSSSLNALAAVTWEDMLKWKFHYLSEARKTIVLKVLGWYLNKVKPVYIEHSRGVQNCSLYAVAQWGPFLGDWERR